MLKYFKIIALYVSSGCDEYYRINFDNGAFEKFYLW
jgi:hypothetical protein